MSKWRRPMIRHVWNDGDHCPGPCPWWDRARGVVVFPIHMIRWTLINRRRHGTFADPTKPERWSWCASVAFTYWKAWYWWDWTKPGTPKNTDPVKP